MVILINGLVLGGIYALLAIGFTLVFGVAKILNFAHTGFYLIGAYIIFTLSFLWGLPLWLAIIIAILLTGILGLICYQLFMERIKEHAIPVMIVTVALALLFQESIAAKFSGTYRSVPPFVVGTTEIAGVSVTYQQLFVIGICFAIVGGVWAFLSKTRMGNAIRAVSQDRETANLMGINVSRICLVTVGISTALAGVAGAVVAPTTTIYPYMWLSPLIIVLAAIILGGFGNIKGSIVGAFILGFTEVAVVFLVPAGAYLRGAVALAIVIIILLIRPEGMFGVVFEEERL